MTIFTKSASIAAIALGAIYTIGIFAGPTISTEIEIASPATAVWSELTNGSAYPDWNPFVKHLSGELTVGNTLSVTIQPAGKSATDFKPELLIVDKNSELRWLGQLGFKGIFDGEHYFILEETNHHTTILHHGENFRGILAYPLLAIIRGDTENGFKAMNAALKARVEAKT